MGVYINLACETYSIYYGKRFHRNFSAIGVFSMRKPFDCPPRKKNTKCPLRRIDSKIDFSNTHYVLVISSHATKGFGRMQIVVLLVSGLIIMTVLTETMGMGLIMTAAHCDMELTPQRKGLISSVSFVGE